MTKQKFYGVVLIVTAIMLTGETNSAIGQLIWTASWLLIGYYCTKKLLVSNDTGKKQIHDRDIVANR